MALCTNCNRRPRPKDDSRMTCIPCTQDREKSAAAEKSRQSAPTHNSLAQYTRLLLWKGHLVGFQCRSAQFVYIRFVPDIAKDSARNTGTKLCDLNEYRPEMDSSFVRRFKASLKQPPIPGKVLALVN